MIPAEPCYSADFQGPNGKPSATRSVVAWDQDGHPMVVGNLGLVRAEVLAVEQGLGKFQGIRVNQLAPYMTAIPGGGWMIERTLPDGTLNIEPVVAWAVCSDGTASPQVYHGNGVCGDPTGKFRIYHPEETAAQPN